MTRFRNRPFIFLAVVAAYVVNAGDLTSADALRDQLEEQYANASINRSRKFAENSNFPDAISSQREALERRAKVFGHWHNDTIECVRNTAGLYLKSGDAERAIVTYQECLAIPTNTSADNRQKVNVLSDLAWILHSTGEYSRALDFYQQVLESSISQRKYAAIAVDAAKLIDDMLCTKSVTVQNRAECWRLTKTIHRWATKSGQTAIAMDVIGQQAQLLAEFGKFAAANELIEDQLRQAVGRAPISTEQVITLTLTQSDIALDVGSYPIALQKLKALSQQHPSVTSMPEFQVRMLLACLSIGDIGGVAAELRRIERDGRAIANPEKYGLILSQAYLRVGELDKGRRACQSLLAKQVSKVDKTELLVELSEIDRSSGELDGARAKLIEATEMWGTETSVPSTQLGRLRERLAQLSMDQGNPAEGRQKFTETVEQFRKAGAKLELARALSNLAECNLQLGLASEATSSFVEAEKLFQEMLGESQPEVWRTRRGLAGAFLANCDFDQAETLYQKELDYRIELGDDVETASIHLALAELYVLDGDFNRARLSLKTAHKLVYNPDDRSSERYASILLAGGSLAYMMGDLALSERALTTALVTSNKNKAAPNWLPARISLALANTYSSQLRFDEAKRQYDGVIKQMSSHAKASNVARRLYADALLGRSGVVRRESGATVQAIQDIKVAAAAYEMCVGEHHPLTAIAYEEMGKCYLASKTIGEARGAYEKCNAICAKLYGDDSPSTLASVNALAELAITEADAAEEGQLKEDKLKMACDLLVNAIDACKRKRDLTQLDSALLGRSHVTLALIYASIGQTKDSLKHHDLALRNYMNYARRRLVGLDCQSQSAFLNGELQLALNAAYSFAMENRTIPEVCQAAAEWSANFKGLNQELNAASCELSRDPSARQKLSELHSQVEAAKSIVRDDKRSGAELLHELEERRNQILSQQTDGNDKNELLNRFVNCSAEWTSIGDVRKQLQSDAIIVDYFVYWKFDSNAATWSKYVGAAVIGRESQSDVRLHDLGDLESVLSGLDRIRDSVTIMSDQQSEPFRQWKAALPDGRKAILAEFKSVLADMFNVTLGDCKEQLADKSRIHICPDDELWLVPWTCLSGSDGFLIESHTVTLIPAMRSLSLETDEAKVANTATVFADPAFSLRRDPLSTEPAAAVRAVATGKTLSKSNDHGTGSVKRVYRGDKPHMGSSESANREMMIPMQFNRIPLVEGSTAIENQLKQIPDLKVTLEVGDDATEVAFRSIHSPRYLIFATHGVLGSTDSKYVKGQINPPWSQWNQDVAMSSSAPLARCALAVAGADNCTQFIAEKEDGLLSGVEIASADLQDTELVLLSATDFGLGIHRCANAIASLYRSFGLAGARSVVGRSWHIDEAASSEFTAEYWKQLADGGDHAVALQNAQMAFLRHDQYCHPYYWAAFSLVQSN